MTRILLALVALVFLIVLARSSVEARIGIALALGLLPFVLLVQLFRRIDRDVHDYFRGKRRDPPA
jgi:hypothetical protein